MENEKTKCQSPMEPCELESLYRELQNENRILKNTLQAIATSNSSMPGPTFMGQLEKCKLLAEEALRSTRSKTTHSTT